MISYSSPMGKKSETTEKHSNRIRDLREAKGWTQSELAQRYAAVSGVEIAYQTVQKWENGTNRLMSDSIKILAEVFGCSADDLFSESAAPALHNKSSINSNLSPRNGAHTASHTKRKVPVYGPASAGDAERILITDEFIVEWDDMPDELENVRDGFKMIVAGTSMEPRYFDGEKVSVHPYRKPNPGQDCVIVDEEGNALVKRYIGETATEWKLSQCNPPKSFSLKKKGIRSIYAVVGRS